MKRERSGSTSKGENMTQSKMEELQKRRQRYWNNRQKELDYQKRPEVKERKRQYANNRYKLDFEWRQKRKEHQKQMRINLKMNVIGYYSDDRMSCQNCKISDIRLLSIDHINGDGAKQKRTYQKGGQQLYRWLIKNSYPEGFQVLCMNCQWLKRFENEEFYKRD